MSTSDKDGPDKLPTDKAKITASSAKFLFVSHSGDGSRLLTGKVSSKHLYVTTSQLHSALQHTSYSFGGTLKGRTKTPTVEGVKVTVVVEGKREIALVSSIERSSRPSEPPALLQIVFRVLLPARVRDAVLGDAQEAYNDTLKRSARPWVATIDYIKEVLYATVGGTWLRLERLISLLRRGS